MARKRRVVVVTGASAGVGRAAAYAFGMAGDSVALMARNTARLEKTAKKIRAMSVEALPLTVDVAHPDEVEQAAARVENELGSIDVWVNNAMVTMYAPFIEITPEEFRRITEVTYLGTVHGTMTALRYMRPRNKGVIIQVGSALSYRAIPLQSAYCGAKFAIRGMTDSVRTELMHEGSAIHITMVQLSAFNTPQFEWARSHIPARPQPVPPIFQPEIAAKAIVWSASHRRRELNVGFPAVKTILGNKLLPGYGDKMASKQAWKGQMDRSSPLPVERPDNLFESVDGDYSSHGRFDKRAKSRSWQLMFTMHRFSVFAVIILGLGVAGWGIYELAT